MPYCPEGWTPLPPQSKIVSCFGGVINGHAGSTAVARQRSLEVDRLLAMGMSQSAIARRMNLNRTTLREHLYKKAIRK
jgi:DNA-binding NarL/FixJ family response regulator